MRTKNLIQTLYRKNKKLALIVAKALKYKIVIVADSKLDTFVNNVIQQSLNLGKDWNKKFPEENIDINYIEEVFRRNFNPIPFIVSAMKSKQYIIGKFARPNKDATKYKKGCFYNALDYILRFSKDYKKLDLAFGVVLDSDELGIIQKAVDEKSTLTYDASHNYLTHAFLVKDNKQIIDPTFPLKKDYYFYKIVPKNIWKKFKHKYNDSSYEAKQFANLVYNTIDRYSRKFNFVERAKKIDPISVEEINN